MVEQRGASGSLIAQRNYKQRRMNVIPFVTNIRSSATDRPLRFPGISVQFQKFCDAFVAEASTGLVVPQVKGVESTCTPSERSKCSAARINNERDSYESPSVACISLSGVGIDRSPGEPSDLRAESTVASSR